MTARREQILQRILVLGQAVSGINTAVRNVVDISDVSLPAFQLFDGNEDAVESDPMNRPTNAPRRVRMVPEMLITVGDQPDTVGTTMNDLSDNFLVALHNDETLRGLTLNGKGLRYHGCDTGLTRGRTMNQTMTLRLEFTYDRTF